MPTAPNTLYTGHVIALWRQFSGRKSLFFFEKEENSIGALTSILSIESPNLAGISGATLGTILIAISTLVTAFVVGRAFGWKLALVCSSVIPVLVVRGFYGVWLVAKLQEQTDRVSKETAAYATEIVTSIQTVFASTRERDVMAYLNRRLRSPSVLASKPI